MESRKSGWVRTPTWLKLLLPGIIWDVPSSEKIVYLTFDDGPSPIVTPKVLDLLDAYASKATFFCLGRKIDEYPEIFKMIKTAGHTIGNHGYEHLNGFITPASLYLANLEKGNRIINSGLFRPPYGKITPRQIVNIRPHAKIVIWSVMSKDYDKHTPAGTCLDNVIKNIYPGAIIVFHDTEQASDNLYYVLPKVLDFLKLHQYKALPLTLSIDY